MLLINKLFTSLVSVHVAVTQKGYLNFYLSQLVMNLTVIIKLFENR